MAQSNKEKQAALRKRRADAGQKEMRGIYVTDAEEKTLKPKIREMLKKMRKQCPDCGYWMTRLASKGYWLCSCGCEVEIESAR